MKSEWKDCLPFVGWTCAAIYGAIVGVSVTIGTAIECYNGMALSLLIVGLVGSVSVFLTLFQVGSK